MPSWRLTLPRWRKDDQTVALRGSKSRNKVSVGEPAEGSLQEFGPPCLNTLFFSGLVGCREAPPSPRTLGLSALWLLRPGPLVRDPFWVRASRGPSRPASPWCRNRPSRSSCQGLLGFVFASPRVGAFVKHWFFFLSKPLPESKPHTMPCSGSIG